MISEQHLQHEKNHGKSCWFNPVFPAGKIALMLHVRSLWWYGTTRAVWRATVYTEQRDPCSGRTCEVCSPLGHVCQPSFFIPLYCFPPSVVCSLELLKKAVCSWSPSLLLCLCKENVYRTFLPTACHIVIQSGLHLNELKSNRDAVCQIKLPWLQSKSCCSGL